MAFLALLFIPPTFCSGISGAVRMFWDNGAHWVHPVHTLVELIELLDPSSPELSNNLLPDRYSEGRVVKKVSSPKVIPVGFYITFSIGSRHSSVTALLSISSNISWIDNYSPPSSSTLKCCNITGCGSSDATATWPCSRDYLLSDQFNLNSTNIPDVMFKSSNTESSLDATGYVSFSRSKFSLINTVERKIFSYFFSFANSYFAMGYVPESTSQLESTKLVQLPDYPNLYSTVTLTELFIGDSPIMNSSSIPVILTTVISITVLKTELYMKFKEALSKIGDLSPDNDSRLEVCFDDPSLTWPDVTLSLLSGSGSDEDAKMVLTSNNYVVRNNGTGKQCGAIIESPGDLSVIGTIAQLNRTMVFDLSSDSEPKLNFSRNPQNSESMPSGLLVKESPMPSGSPVQESPMPSGSPAPHNRATSLMIPNPERYLIILLLLHITFVGKMVQN